MVVVVVSILRGDLLNILGLRAHVRLMPSSSAHVARLSDAPICPHTPQPPPRAPSKEIRDRTSVVPFAAILDGRQVLPPDVWKEFVRAP